VSPWKTAVLADIARVFNGKTPSKLEQRDKGHAVLKIKDVDESGNYRGKFDSFVERELAEKFQEKQVRQGDTLILNAAHNADYVGSKTFLAKPATYGALATGEWLIIRPDKERLDPIFVHHWVNFPKTRRQIRDRVNGIHLYPKDVALLEIPVPPLPEQKRIAEMLDRAEALRAKRCAALAQLDTLTQSIFLDLFGDPQKQHSDFELVEFGQLTSRITYGFTCPMEHLVSGIPIITAKNVRHGFIDFENCHFASKAQFDSLTEKCKPTQGDLLITKDGAIRGRCALVVTQSDFCISQAVALIRPNRTKALPEYLWSYIVSDRIQKKIMDMDKGVAMPHLQITELAKFPIGLPPMEIQHEFARRATAVEKLKTAHRQSLAELDALFASLQHRAFRGEL
jgi:type I restriction enzyme, S subunit